jgi:hypothetical protein
MSYDYSDESRSRSRSRDRVSEARGYGRKANDFHKNRNWFEKKGLNILTCGLYGCCMKHTSRAVKVDDKLQKHKNKKNGGNGSRGRRGGGGSSSASDYSDQSYI